MVLSRATPETQTARILIVDDHPVARDGLAIWISSQPDLEVCGETGSATEALRLVGKSLPDVAILDVILDDGNGIDLIPRIHSKAKSIRILVWSMHDENLYAERALRAGAMGYINKREATSSICDAIRCILQDKIYLSESLAGRILHQVARGDPAPIQDPIGCLSNRELEIFRLIGQGAPTSDIAKKLHISIKTVETHRQRVKRKLKLHDGTELIRRALQWVMENG